MPLNRPNHYKVTVKCDVTMRDFPGAKVAFLKYGHKKSDAFSRGECGTECPDMRCCQKKTWENFENKHASHQS